MLDVAQGSVHVSELKAQTWTNMCNLTKVNKVRVIACNLADQIRGVPQQWCIQNPIKHLRWSVSQK